MTVHATKLDRLDGYLAASAHEELWFLRPENAAWLTDGANTVVDRASDLGVAALGYDGDTVRAVTANNEADRMREEELPPAVPVTEFPWYDSTLADAVANEAGADAVADVPGVPGLGTVDAGRFRLPLTDEERRRYADAGRDAAEAVETVARNVTQTDTERQTANRLREALRIRGLEYPVVLVGGAGRAQRHRHFTPTDQALGDYAVLTVVAVAAGVNVAVTRTVAFDPPAWLADRHAAASRVAATAAVATREGVATDGTAADVFDAVRLAYDAVGWSAEWKHHHQGGAIGYQSREWTAAPGTDYPITAPSAYAWNPTVQGAKSEDTVLVTADTVDVLTDTGSWPMSTYEAVGHEATLALPDVLRKP